MIVAVTGPEKPKAGASIASFAVSAAIQKLCAHPVTEFRTGAAKGIDTSAYFCAVAAFRDAITHRVFVPRGCRYNQDLVLFAKQEHHDVVGIDGGYLKRDDALVEGADLLLAFPDSDKEVLRSGTWATIRRARKRGIEVQMIPLDTMLEAVLKLPL